MLKYTDFFSDLCKTNITEHFADYTSVPTEEEGVDWFINKNKKAILSSVPRDWPKLLDFIKKNNYPHRMITFYGDTKHLVATKTLGKSGENELDTIQNIVDAFWNSKTVSKEKYHRTLGNFLGYSPKDIETFIYRGKHGITPPRK